MRRLFSLLLYFFLGLGVVVGLELLTTHYAVAQGSETIPPVLVGTALVFLIFFYIFFAFTMQTIATKLNIGNSWFAWIPLLNAWLWVKIAGRPDWWVILLFIPLVNLIISIIMLFDVPARLNKPSLLALLCLIPGFGIFIYLGILAFT
ncbi:MAG: hypothetical protein CV045_07905 [Cyanobacteria bacterium M5B4]|nr:MAG: hypothetical protein CV045_07905 [Cyanobacteria bacterium M5B4]